MKFLKKWRRKRAKIKEIEKQLIEKRIDEDNWNPVTRTDVLKELDKMEKEEK